MAIHAEMNEGYRAAAQMLDDFRTEMARRRAAHTDLVLRLSDGRVDSTETVTRTASEAAEMLLAGSVPNSRADDLRAAQAEEEALRQQLGAMEPLERRLAEQAELARVKAREAAIRNDPRTAQIAKRWQAAEQAVRAALDAQAEQTRDLIGGAFGRPDEVRPFWLQVGMFPSIT
jgi:beta-galactosidase/beta-glucuronidase